MTLLLWAVPAVAAQGGRPPKPVVTAPVERAAVRPRVVLVGTVRPRYDSLVAAEVGGIVHRVGARRGQPVRRGAVLAVLRDADLEDELASARAEVKLAQAERAKAEADLARARELVEKQVAPVEQLDSARRDAEVWEQRLAIARSTLRMLENRAGRQTVRAPFDGVVVEEHAEVGEWVPKGGPVARVVDYAVVLVRVPVPEQYVVGLGPGQSVAVTFDAVPGGAFAGAVAAVIPVGDAQARTFPVEVRVDNSEGLVRPGMTGRVSLPAGEPREESLVPKDALVPRGPATLVYAVVEGKAVEVPVEVVGYEGDKAAVRGPLPPGAPVIVRGNERVRPGEPVQPTAR
ncbi:MAG: hypothetical protein Kow0092_03970 [Deferrisomatales bacterium]